MKVTIIGRRVDVPEDLKTWADKKFSKLDKFFEDDTEIRVTLWTERGRFLGEGTIHHKGTIFRAEENEGDFFSVVDGMTLAIERQIAKNKTRLAKKLRSGSIANLTPEIVRDSTEEGEYKIIKNKKYAAKPMSVDEAILQMNLLGHEFFVFFHDKTNDKNVVYKRKDGNYGLIELD